MSCDENVFWRTFPGQFQGQRPAKAFGAPGDDDKLDGQRVKIRWWGRVPTLPSTGKLLRQRCMGRMMGICIDHDPC